MSSGGDKVWTWEEPISLNDIYHHGILGQRWYVRRYQPYPSGKRPNGAKEIGEAAKVKISGSDKKNYNIQQKRTGAAYKALKKDVKLVNKAEKNVVKAEKEYKKAVKKKVLNPFNKTKKQERMTNIILAEDNLSRTSTVLRQLESNRAAHKESYDKEMKKLADMTNKLANKYNDIKPSKMNVKTKNLGKDWTVSVLSNQKHAGIIASHQYNKYYEKERKKG